MRSRSLGLYGRAQVRQCECRGIPVIDRLNRNHLGRVPEFVEYAGQMLHDGTHGHHIVVTELRIRVDLKVLIADVAAADERDRIVGHQELIMHPIVEPVLVEQEFCAAHNPVVSPVSERIEHADLDALLRRQRGDLFIAGDGFSVIQDDPDADAPVGGPQQRRRDDESRLVSAENVVLQVQRMPSRIDQLDACQQTIQARREHLESGARLVRAGCLFGGCLLEDASHSRRRARREGMGFLLRKTGARHGRACRKQTEY